MMSQTKTIQSAINSMERIIQRWYDLEPATKRDIDSLALWQFRLKSMLLKDKVIQ